jgi:hypothetical protein
MKKVAPLVLLGVLGSVALAGENPQVAAIHEQIKVVNAEKKVTLKNMHAWYETVIKRDKFTGAVILEDRKILKAQEDTLLALTADETTRKAIHEHYDGVRGLLKEGTAIDNAAVKELRRMEKVHETIVGDAYKIKVAELEALAKAAAAGKTTKPKK